MQACYRIGRTMKGIAVVIIAIVTVAHADVNCPVEQEIGSAINLLLAHKDCSKFYTCNNGLPNERNCPSGLLFNTEQTQCNRASDIDCSHRIVFNGGYELGPETNIGITNDVEDEEIELQENGCPVNPYISWLVPDPDDCGAFFQCLWGQLVPKKCAGGLHFNPAIQVCDWPDSAGCRVSDEDNENDSDNDDDEEDNDDESDENGNENEDIEGNESNESEDVDSNESNESENNDDNDDSDENEDDDDHEDNGDSEDNNGNDDSDENEDKDDNDDNDDSNESEDNEDNDDNDKRRFKYQGVIVVNVGLRMKDLQ